MKRITTILAFAVAVPGLAGCGDRTGGNAATDQNTLQQANENVPSNELQNVGSPAPANNVGATPATPDANAVTPAPDERPAAGNGRARADDTTRPAPKATPPQPVPDRHAGHDMGNMANMSHH